MIVEEEDLLNGNLEDVTIEGVTDVLKKRKRSSESSIVVYRVSASFSGM